MPAFVEQIDRKSVPGRRGANVPVAVEEVRARGREAIPEGLRRREAPRLPEVSELEAVRHFTRLAQRNFSIDGQFYPLGSCTMKYNPRVNEQVAALPGFTGLHPLQDDADCQGTLRVLFRLQEELKKILGLPTVTLAPAAGAQGEYAGMAAIRAYLRDRGEEDRRTVLVPDSAHGTNPASAALAGFEVRTIPSDKSGRVDLQALKGLLNDKVAALMLTNPNTCGVFEKDILEIARLAHAAGALLYYDGANLNAIVGRVRPGDMGFDVVHVNLHKTFSTPHGGGGPGAGAVGLGPRLSPYAPASLVFRDDDGTFCMSSDPDLCRLGRLMAFHGNAGVLLRALAYTLAQGGEGLWKVASYAVLNANYVLARLPEVFEVPFGRPCKHEALVTIRKQTKSNGIKAFDVAKRLLDLGFHAPTIYFPLLVPECLLIEPTETESKETLDAFVEAMERIATEMREDPDSLREAPSTLANGRLDDARAARELNVCCRWDARPDEGC
ncbi:MAG: aminomethyl-transferring glycine dehydrogenase subunit GcvPB [Candidatus Sumerlaeia bacterium]|nr:aminomethyl-transferring glycine dehydrogenase subunit GcvPB [Candidatus Sumerlaeia bacterium]